MAYIGKEPIVGNFQKCDAITVVNGQAAYTLQVSSTNVTPESANHMLVSLNGILQAPVTSFSVSGSTLTFVSNLATGDVIDFVILLGNVLDLGTPSDGTVTPAKLSGVTQGITEADQWRLTTAFKGDVEPIASNLERNDSTAFDKIGTGMSESSGVFTFPSTGYWLVRFIGVWYATNPNESRFCRASVQATTNNSTYVTAGFGQTNVPVIDSAFTYATSTTETIVDVTDTANVKVRFAIDVQDTDISTSGETSRNETFMTFIRLGDT